MKTLVALRHVPFEDLGSLAPIAERLGYQVTYYEVGVGDLTALKNQSIDLLVVLGGPIGAYDDALYPYLADELAFIQQRLQLQQPILGICLGAQLMARALGAAVAPMGHKEIGFAPLTLTSAGQQSVLKSLNTDVAVLHWHGDQFALPQGCHSLATTPLCPYQAFALGHYALALQFHLEVDIQRLEQWLIGHSAELNQAGINPHTLRQQAQIHESALTQAASQVLSAWLNQL
jgi:GMP synthase (glutamine-hydrolysing)